MNDEMEKRMISIRKCSKDDAERLVEICHITGDTSFDPMLFGLRWCLDYVWHETDHCFVAVDEDGYVAGYLLSTMDTVKQEERFHREMVPKIKARWREIGGKSLKVVWKYHRHIKPRKLKVMDDVVRQYPAHMHIDIDPKYQRQGIGHLLMASFEEHVMAQGVKGFHLVVGAGNKKGIPFYEKYGLKRLKDIKVFGKTVAIAYGKQYDV